jgi:hypothetical protein
MHLKVGLPFVSLLAFGWVPDTGRAAEPSAAGLWEKRDTSGKPEGWFRITEAGTGPGKLALLKM